jgi:hypothetical protein
MPRGIQMASTLVPKSKVATIKFTPDQHKLIAQSARRCGVTATYWMRFILTQAASRQPYRGYLHIREPEGGIT